MALFRRAKRSPDPVASPADVSGERIGGKGRPTPKRQRAAPPQPPPRSRKEAYARLREKSREQQAKARVGMREGDDRYVLPRDRGPARRLVRDIVDSRRNVGSYSFGLAIAIFLVSSTPGVSPAVQLAISYVWLVIIALIFVDSYVLSRIIRRAVLDRFPDEKSRMRGHTWYGVIRALTFRRLRTPRPQVKIGDSV